MKFDLHGKTFRSVSNTDNGEVSSETLFHYCQKDNVVTADYAGGSIVEGHLIGRMLPNGALDIRYHHLNDKGELMLGKCTSTPELLPDGRIKLCERWQWLSGDQSEGYSEVEEVEP